MNNKCLSVFCLLLVRPLSMSSNTFVYGARTSGVCVADIRGGNKRNNSSVWLDHVLT